MSDSPSNSLIHKLRLQVFSLKAELKSLRSELQEIRRLANESLIETTALKHAQAIAYSMSNAAWQGAPLPPPEISDTPEDLSAPSRAEKIVEQLFDGLDGAFGRPRGM